MKSISSKRREICDAAISWLGTPYQHQAMVKGPQGAVDCAMLIAGIALDVNLIGEDDIKKIPNYPREWHLHNDDPLLTGIMEGFGCVEKNVKYLHPGDIIVFKLGRVPSHLGILLENNKMVHAYGGTVGKVAQNELSGKWTDRLVKAYKFPGV